MVTGSLLRDKNDSSLPLVVRATPDDVIVTSLLISPLLGVVAM